MVTSFAASQTADFLNFDSASVIKDSLYNISPDSLGGRDSLIISKVAKVDSLVPIQGVPLSEQSTVISRKTFLFTNYRYTGDLLRSFSLNFVKDLGFVGQPHETFIYGIGNGCISYLQDGVLWNNRYTNSLDLNLVQSEDVDSIEIVPSPRGFLYGPFNNPVAVNFIMRDFVSPEPYSRIKYYEGPDGEAMVDGKFSARIAKRWNLAFQITNRNYDSSYTNSEFSIWQANAKLKYFLSNSVNFSGWYYFVKSNQGLNGGVDIDSVNSISGDPNEILYEPLAAPVINPIRKLEVTQHNFGLRTQAKPFEGSNLDLSLYYRYNLNENTDAQDSISSFSETESKTFGGFLNYSQKISPITLQLISRYERRELPSFNSDLFGVGGLLSAEFLNGILIPSIFYKYNSWKSFSDFKYSGIGGDVSLIPFEFLKFYAGYSVRDEFFINKSAGSIEVGGTFHNEFLFADIKYFSIEFDPYKFTGRPEAGITDNTEKVNGIGFILNYKLWLILLETNTSYYFTDKDQQLTNVPDWQFIGGVYVADKFFDSNLNLKTGLKFYYTGNIKTYAAGGLTSVEPTHKLDFTLAGEIQGAAIFYFIWENLLGNQYFITPYYPMPESNVRFGLAWELFN